MKQSFFMLKQVRKLTADTYELSFEGDTSAITAPGQFVNIALPEKYLRRPISVCDWSAGHLTLLVKAVGEGTRELVKLAPGTELDTLSGLGNGFSLEGSTQPLLVGGGIGIAPLYGLAGRLAEKGISATVILGYRTQKDIFYVEEFKALGCRVFISTEDGSAGTKGFVTDAIREHCGTQGGWNEIMACGPIPMLKAVWQLPNFRKGQFSLEARMACGFGACVGCTISTVNGPRRVCKDGPIFRKEELAW